MKAETGRELFEFRPTVDYKVKHTFGSAEGERPVTQLIAGYTRLNEYLCKVIYVVESKKCNCGEIESVRSYLILCHLFH